MPTYEYYCPANHKTLEVMHSMSRSVSTWGELCELAGAKPGKTEPTEPVEKLLSAGMVITGDKDMPTMDCANPGIGPGIGPGIAPGGCCGGGCKM